MPVTGEERSQIRFGPFSVDLAARELLKGGAKVRLQGLPFQILIILLERPGEWVTREELQQRLWPSDVFVDFEHSINTAVGKLRRALGDDAGEPCFIETLPRHGYRLIASPEAGPATENSGQEMPSFSGVVRAEQRKWTKRFIASGVVLLAAALCIVGLLHPWRRSAALTAKDTIVLADFDNQTGDSLFDGTLKQALAVELEQSPYLSVLSDQKVTETLSMMGRPANDRITADMGRELCIRSGGKALLTGSIARLGDHYVLGLKAIACNSGDTLARDQNEATSKSDVLSSLSRVTSRMRNKLGESLSSVQNFNVPFQATTSSLEALKYYSTGLTVIHSNGEAPGIPFLKKAIELDPNFPLAYAELSLAYGDLREPSLALEYAAKAYQLRDRTTKEESLKIAAMYFIAIGELDKEIQTYQLMAAAYPNNPMSYANLGADYSMLGQNDKARMEFEKALSLAPDVVNVYTGLAASYIFLDRLDDAGKTINAALARKLDDGGLRQFLYYLAFLAGDNAKMEQQLTWAVGKPGDEDALLSLQSDTEAYYGRMKKAREYSLRAVNSAVNADSQETAALWQVNIGLREAEVGDSEQAIRDVDAALELSPGKEVKQIAALALARAGAASRAGKIAEELGKTYPSDTILNLYGLPTIYAASALSRGDTSRALAILDRVTPYELAEGQNLYPAYLRGQAYLMAHNGPAATAEFQKLLDHRGLMVNFITGSLAHLQIARAYAMSGNAAKAKAAYLEYFGLWNNADSGLSVLRQAKTEFAKLP